MVNLNLKKQSLCFCFWFINKKSPIETNFVTMMPSKTQLNINRSVLHHYREAIKIFHSIYFESTEWDSHRNTFCYSKTSVWIFRIYSEPQLLIRFNPIKYENTNKLGSDPPYKHRKMCIETRSKLWNHLKFLWVDYQEFVSMNLFDKINESKNFKSCWEFYLTFYGT